MSIKYVVLPNALRPGQFYPRPVQADVKDMEVLLREVAEKTTVSPHDAKAVVSAFIQEIVNGLVDGDRVSIAEFADFSPRLSQIMTSAAGEFDPSNGEVHIAATIKSPVTRQVREKAKFVKLMQGKKVPVLASFLDGATEQHGFYTAGGTAEIIGKNVQIFDKTASDEGIYFVHPETGAETKVSIIQSNGTRSLIFKIPDELTGPQNVEVRTRYTPFAQIRRGMLDNILPA